MLQVLSALDHYYGDHAYLFMKVLQALVVAVKTWYPYDPTMQVRTYVCNITCNIDYKFLVRCLYSYTSVLLAQIL